MDFVIMCAGEGKRLHPLTKDKPKCMIEIHEKPIIDHILDSIDDLRDKVKISKVIIIDGYKSKVLRDHLKDRDVIFIKQKKLNGTAKAVELVKNYILDDFIVLAGDTIYSKTDILKLTKKENSFLYFKHSKNLRELGTIEFNCRNQVVKIHEKSSNPISNYVNISGYHFTQAVFDYIPKTEPVKEERIITNTINLMLKEGIEFKGVHAKVWTHITYPEDIDLYNKMKIEW